MREIKFRAWNKIKKKMMLPVLKLAHNVYGINSSEVNNGNEIELMQYTGLKDKNGKEIYEGDIITRKGTHDCASSLFEDDKNKKEFISIVEWKFDMWYCSYGNYHNTNPVDQVGGVEKTNELIEVIGNIYENTNLIPISHNKSTRGKKQ